jgi:hypothetical protein
MGERQLHVLRTPVGVGVVLEMRPSAHIEQLGRVLAEDLAEDPLAPAEGIKVASATREG